MLDTGRPKEYENAITLPFTAAFRGLGEALDAVDSEKTHKTGVLE